MKEKWKLKIQRNKLKQNNTVTELINKLHREKNQMDMAAK